ncbi:hypothetical protein EBZ80_14615 [bacterium]|nr:hypothetical protein [bacterium]
MPTIMSETPHCADVLRVATQKAASKSAKTMGTTSVCSHSTMEARSGSAEALPKTSFPERVSCVTVCKRTKLLMTFCNEIRATYASLGHPYCNQQAAIEKAALTAHVVHCRPSGARRPGVQSHLMSATRATLPHRIMNMVSMTLRYCRAG